MPSPVQPMMLMTSLQLDAPLSIQVMATSPTASASAVSSAKTVYVRMRNVSGSVAIELSPAITSVHALIQHFHERVFSKSYVSLVCFALCIALLVACAQTSKHATQTSQQQCNSCVCIVVRILTFFAPS